MCPGISGLCSALAARKSHHQGQQEFVDASARQLLAKMLIEAETML